LIRFADKNVSALAAPCHLHDLAHVEFRSYAVAGRPEPPARIG